LINRGDINLPDGRPVAALAKYLGLTPSVERVGGPDLMDAVLDQGRKLGLRHYLYGSTEQTITLLRQRLLERYPGVQLVGSEAPPFRPLEASERRAMIDRIRAADPHIVWVGLGTPKQDEFVDRFRDELGTTLIAIGAAFDFLAGVKPRAPLFVQRVGLEWAFRLATEPRRLWRRYLLGGVSFLRGVSADWRADRNFGLDGRTQIDNE
jgi:N-acetylglucosaminyldiphosphoundecaprenol N-acetyl-beta-D-mannosaminyltransferase